MTEHSWYLTFVWGRKKAWKEEQNRGYVHTHTHTNLGPISDPFWENESGQGT